MPKDAERLEAALKAVDEAWTNMNDRLKTNTETNLVALNELSIRGKEAEERLKTNTEANLVTLNKLSIRGKEMNKFMIGDKVNIKSGGPCMTITELPTTSNNRYECMWYGWDPNPKFQKTLLPGDALDFWNSVKEKQTSEQT